MTKKQALQQWKSDVLPLIKEKYERDNIIDFVARRESWYDYTNWLCDSGHITVAQYDMWMPPRCACGPAQIIELDKVKAVA